MTQSNAEEQIFVPIPNSLNSLKSKEANDQGTALRL